MYFKYVFQLLVGLFQLLHNTAYTQGGPAVLYQIWSG